MKKLVTAACALVAGMAMAQVQSANTVGFTTTANVGAGKFALGAIQFQNTTGASANINDILTCSVATPDYDAEDNYIDGWYQDAAQIQIRVGDGYMIYYYCSQAETYDPVADEYDYIPGWTNMSGNWLDDVTIAPGIGVWFKGPVGSAADFTVAGQVNGAATAAISGATGFNLLANPFPEGFNLNDGKVDFGLTGTPDYDAEDNYIDGWYNDATQIQIRVGEGYMIYYFCSQAETYDPDKDEYDYIPGWTNMSGNWVDDVDIPVGAGFWIKANAAFNGTATK